MNKINRTNWPAGPWDDEPDTLEFIDDFTGMECEIKRNFMGSLCGYVGIAPEHPYYGKTYSDPLLKKLDMHDGLTCSRRLNNKFWIELNCGHHGDLHPSQASMPTAPKNVTYKDIAYVKRELEHLAFNLHLAQLEHDHSLR